MRISKDNIILYVFAILGLGLVFFLLVSQLQSHFILNDKQKIFAEKAAQFSLRTNGWCDICKVSASSFGTVESTANRDRMTTVVTFTSGEIIIYLHIDLDTGTVVETIQTTKEQERQNIIIPD